MRLHVAGAIDERGLDASAVAAAVGVPWLLHVHSSVAEVREFVGRLRAIFGELTYVLTLHDVTFADTTLDAPERDARARFINDANQVITPSRYIAELAIRELVPPPHISTIQPACHQSCGENVGSLALSGAPQSFPIAVVGALGLHKGLQFLIEVAKQLPLTHPIALIGYTDGQLAAGWLVKDKIWVHGAFQPDETKALLDAYGSSIVFFPNRQAEGYSYALSDAWQAGRSALVPDLGALGSRVAETGGGWRYAPDSSAQTVARLLQSCIEPRFSISTIS